MPGHTCLHRLLSLREKLTLHRQAMASEVSFQSDLNMFIYPRQIQSTFLHRLFRDCSRGWTFPCSSWILQYSSMVGGILDKPGNIYTGTSILVCIGESLKSQLHVSPCVKGRWCYKLPHEKSHKAAFLQLIMLHVYYGISGFKLVFPFLLVNECQFRVHGRGNSILATKKG